ncbi:MAG: OmpA family protein [Proteobacteria bacterium]|nr:OmpA family protein [Pseudomonadota bacterium]
MASAPRPSHGFRLAHGLLIAVALTLSACASQSSFTELDATQPTGSDFNQALFKNYRYLAHSYGKDVGGGSGTAFDAGGTVSLNDVDADVTNIAEAFASKAVLAAQGENVLPEPAPEGDEATDKLRTRLLTALEPGRDKAPALAARAQADYDCWVLNAQVAAQAAASAQCKRSFDGSLAQLERAANPPPPPPVTQTTTTTAAPADFTVYFDFDSWTLSAEALTILTQAIDTARAGGQSHINIVGHADTSGTADYNQRLSERRANVVKEVLVQMGARPEAVTVYGTGESDLAVQTADGVREPKNRRAVVTLAP